MSDDQVSDDVLQMYSDDVTVEPIHSCTCECGKPVTHAVWLDMRPIGIKSVVLEACEECARSCADALAKSLKPA